MRLPIILLVLIPAAVTASAPMTRPADPLAAELASARADADAAERESARLDKLASRQRDAATKLRAQQEAAAASIIAAEAQISAADTEARLLAARLARQRAALRRQQAPATALLGGLAMMAQRPPILALADRGGTDEFVRVRLLIDSTLPVIHRKTATLSQQLSAGRKLQADYVAARQSAMRTRKALQDRQQAFAALEQKTLQAAGQSGLAALGAGDLALSRSESGDELLAEQRRRRSEAAVAAEISALGAPADRPFAPEGSLAPALGYRLPATAQVSEGFGSISDNGIRSRGITMATGRGTTLAAPADGTILFAGPYRTQDGIIIIDHGRGWTSLILNAATERAKGTKVQAGEPIGRALGPIGVELSRNGLRLSPALIAGSSATLSK